MGKCLRCGKETIYKVCDECAEFYGVKAEDCVDKEQEQLDIESEKYNTSGFEYLLHTLAFLCILSSIAFINDSDYIFIAYAVGGCISFEIIAQIIKWIRLAVNELIEIKSKMK